MNDGQKALLTARSLVEMGRWRDAALALEPALVSEETAYDALCLRAHCLLNAGSELSSRWEREAREAAEAALRLDPHRSWAHRLMASLLLGDQRYGAALREAAEAARLAPDEVWTLDLLARCQLAVFRVDEAQRTAQAAVEADPQEPIAYLTLADVARTRNDWAAAEHAYRNGLRLDPNHERLAMGLADLLFLLRRPLESATVYLAAARINPRNAALRKALGEIWWQLEALKHKWQLNPRSMDAPELDRLAELISPACSPPIEAAVRDLLSAASEARAEVEKLLERALEVFAKVARSLGAKLYKSGASLNPLKIFDHPGPVPLRPVERLDWRVLDMEGDPVPGDVSGFGLVVTTFNFEAERTADYAGDFDAVAGGSGELRVQDGDGSDFHELMVEIRTETTRLATAYSAGADALSAFADSVRLARQQASGAQVWARNAYRRHEWAVTSFRSLVPAAVGPEDGEWRTLDESMAEELTRDISDPDTKERAIDTAREAREWERERQEAIRSALTAVNIRSKAEADCVAAIRATLPIPPATDRQHDDSPAIDKVPDAARISHLLS
ncbi:tetratricopeptide repeat protein [Nonomuraea sediminis]|uniref:tetratricopeptide repeat protein n=1 Tax=Nonomuraea sediminis TaxID=2835864 RepID=UPI001BDD1F63|nr:tetratricopeptide repeat protein [Nonomuraea sediminis]